MTSKVMENQQISVRIFEMFSGYYPEPRSCRLLVQIQCEFKRMNHLLTVTYLLILDTPGGSTQPGPVGNLQHTRSPDLIPVTNFKPVLAPLSVLYGLCMFMLNCHYY